MLTSVDDSHSASDTTQEICPSPVLRAYPRPMQSGRLGGGGISEECREYRPESTEARTGRPEVGGRLTAAAGTVGDREGLQDIPGLSCESLRCRPRARA